MEFEIGNDSFANRLTAVPDLISSHSQSYYSRSNSPAPLSPTLNNSFLSLDIHSPTQSYHTFSSYAPFDPLAQSKSLTRGSIHSTLKSTTAGSTLPNTNYTASWDQLEWSAGSTDSSDNQSDLEVMGKAEKYWLANQTPSMYQPQIFDAVSYNYSLPKIPEAYSVGKSRSSPLKKKRVEKERSESEFSEGEDNDSVYSLPSCESLASFSPRTRSTKMSFSKSVPNSLSSYAGLDEFDSTPRKIRKYSPVEESEESDSIPIKTPKRRNSLTTKSRRKSLSTPTSPQPLEPYSNKCLIKDSENGMNCSANFKKLSDLNKHKELIHNVFIPKTLSTFGRTDSIVKKTSEWGCKGCGGFFSRKDALIRHRRIKGCE